MSVVGDLAAALGAAAGSVEGVQLTTLGASLNPPAVVVGPPRFTPLGVCAGPATATFPVTIAVALDDRALERLWELVPAVWEAIEDQTDAVVIAADPGTYSTGSGDLPAYELTVEHPI